MKKKEQIERTKVRAQKLTLCLAMPGLGIHLALQVVPNGQKYVIFNLIGM
jgi:hypothetical protein